MGYWIEITTKPIFKGTYNLYLYSVGKQGKILWSFDGVQYPDMVSLKGQFDPYGNDVRMYYKNNMSSYEAIAKRKLGVFTFNEINSHKIRIDAVDVNTGYSFCKFQFEPVN